MKKILISILISLGLITAGFFAYRPTPVTSKTIAIITPATHPSLEAMTQAFISKIKKTTGETYRFVIYNAQGNKTLMYSEIEQVAKSNHTLVLTLGTTASKMTKELFHKKNISTPIVFTCTPNPVDFHIVESEDSPGKGITGIKEIVHLKDELGILLKAKPDIRSILLPYNPGEASIHKDVELLKVLLKEKNIKLICVETFQTNEILAKVSPFVHKVDAMIVLKDNTVVSGLEALIKLCNSQHIPLMASDLDSPGRGAAFGYGVYEKDFGTEAAIKALQILQQGLSPEQIPVTSLSSFTLRINEEAARHQGIDLSLLQSLEYETTP